ncbi:hypothetical protein [Arthrobacter oryzae]|uniref:Lipoprotein n=1 Tax=Arthrobacter oryzae TaxID=409290 RepID=A0A3N0BW29_9MICC|nr:hypothetical protein [Arthrobacter oryzae]RNL53199.1 hypothetical protein D7003_13005 [Arthrobacter oryzae]
MKKILAVLTAATFLIVLGGCGQVQDAAEKAVNDGASQVATAAAGEIKKQACSVAGDGLISLQDKKLLGGLVAGAESAGVASDITAALRQISDSGDQVPAEALTALQNACDA